MKTNIYMLLIITLILLSCDGNTVPKDALKEEFPSSVKVYYKHNDYPLASTGGVVWFGPKDWLGRPLSKITLTDRKSLDYFNGLRLKAESEGSVNSFPGRIWFSALVDYETHIDTVSIGSYRVLYNDKAFQDSTAVFYYLSKIQEVDSVTFNAFDESFYDNDFQLLLKESSSQVPEVNIGLNDKIKELFK